MRNTPITSPETQNNGPLPTPEEIRRSAGSNLFERLRGTISAAIAKIPGMATILGGISTLGIGCVPTETRTPMNPPSRYESQFGIPRNELEKREKTPNNIIKISTVSELQKLLQLYPKAMILVGTTWCAPCKVAKEMWETRSTGGFQMIYLNFQNEQEPGKMNLAGNLRRFNPGVDSFSYPIILIVEDGQNISAAFHGLSGSTNGAARWLNQNGH